MVQCELVVVRHGETESNRSHIVQGHRDTSLSAVGERQAARVAAHLAAEQFTKVLSSDLSRAHNTARAIVAAGPDQHQQILKWELLRERGFGDLEGGPAAAMQEAARGRSKAELLDWGPPGGETGLQFRTRVRTALSELGPLLAGQAGARVLLATHGGWIKELNTILVREFNCEMPGPEGAWGRICPNTGLSRFTLDLDSEGGLVKAVCIKLYDKEHLEGEEEHEPINYGV